MGSILSLTQCNKLFVLKTPFLVYTLVTLSVPFMISHRGSWDASPLLGLCTLPEGCNTDQKAENTSLGSLNWCFRSLQGHATLTGPGTSPVRQLGHFPCEGTEGGHKFKQTETSSAQLNIPTPSACKQGYSSDPAKSYFRKLNKNKLASVLVKLSELSPPWAETSPNKCTRKTRLHSW